LNFPVPPVVVGAVGGSGTRVVGGWLREAGVQLGGPANQAGDALRLRPLFLSHVVPYWREALDADAFRRDLGRLLADHRRSMDPSRPWGWKNPGSLYLLPLLDRALPGMRFIHVVRHGLDMALSDNRNPLRKYGDAVVGSGWRDLPPPLAAARLWARANARAADYGRAMGRRYHRLRYEDLCDDPGRVFGELAAFLDLPAPAGDWDALVRPAPPRRHALDPALRRRIEGEIGPVLERFGYRC